MTSTSFLYPPRIQSGPAHDVIPVERAEDSSAGVPAIVSLPDVPSIVQRGCLSNVLGVARTDCFPSGDQMVGGSGERWLRQALPRGWSVCSRA